MEKVWNDFHLKKPPFITLPGKYHHFVQKLHAVIDNYFNNYAQCEQEFNETAALLSRLMARRKNSFKRMSGFKDVCKLNAALCRLLRVDFKRDLDSFRNILPDVDYVEGTSVQLPTRNSFEFVLIRLITIYELYRRIIDCCVSAAEYFTCQIRLYFFFEINTLLLAVLAKIRSMSIKLLNLTAVLYNNSISYRFKLSDNLKCKFLKDSGFVFPAKLEINKLNGLDNETVAAKYQSLNALLHAEEKLAPVKALKLKKTDVGEKIERSSNLEQRKFNIKKLNSVEEIKQFIAVETKSRKANLNKSITAKILSHEWWGAIKLFERKVQKDEVKKAVDVFRKFLSLKI